jgi:tartrate dehydrogenase/decarboxylase/D-malate dehydrogenase
VTYDIATIPGDGIGQTVVDAALPVLREAGDAYGFDLDVTEYDWGTERYREEGEMMPDNATDQLESYDSILLGAVGHPEVPDHVTLHGLLLPIRKELNQYVCKRPSVLYECVESPLRGYEGEDIDFVVYRENTEGEYSDIGGREHRGFESEVAIQSALFTREGVERIARQAFQTASDRSGKLTNVTKSNAQAYGMVLWDDVIEEVSEEFPDVTVERLLVDAASMDLVRRPEEFDVIVASNLFGDILTDIGAVVSGSVGLAPSANLNPDGPYPSLFEPVHGSAPDIVGQKIANPLATVLSGAMLLEDLDEVDAAKGVRDAVRAQLADPDGPRTPDLGGGASTDVAANDLEDRL